MRKFRMIKIEKECSSGNLCTYYQIQKKFLFWYFRYRLMLACGDGNPIIGIIGYNLYRRHIAIQDKEKAFDIFGKLENNQLIEKYKGYIIEHRIDTKDLSYVYVSNVYRTCKGYYCYSHSIKEIKNIIDKKVRIKENNDVVRIKKMVVS